MERVISCVGDYTDDAILITEAEPFVLPGPRIVWCNSAFTRMTGYTLDEVKGKTPRILQGEDTDPKALAKIRRGLETWSSFRVELKNYRKDGTAFWVDLGLQPVTDEDGWHHYWVGIQRETTERHEREGLLRQTTKLIDGAPVGLGLLTSDGRLSLANEHLLHLVFDGRLPPALPMPYDAWLRSGLSSNPKAKIPRTDIGAWVERQVSGLLSASARVEQRIGGVWHEFRLIKTPSGDRLLVVEDIEERIALQEELRQITKLDAMGKLTSGVAHDFNNILAAILGNIELIQAGEGTTEDRDLFLSETVNAVVKGRSLTQSLLSFAKKSRMNREPVDATALLSETVDMFRRTSGAGLEVSLHLEGDIPKLIADPGLFQNAALNLLINARDAMSSGGVISVFAGVEPDMTLPSILDNGSPAPVIRISVSDTGQGMSPEVIAQAIEPFYTTKPAGSGLGLSMVHGFAEQSGGKLEFDRRDGSGMTISMLLPASAEATGELSDSEDLPIGLRNTRIFLIEDEVPVRRVLVKMLEGSGAEVVAAASGDEALRLRESWKSFDLFMTDLVMPGALQGDRLAAMFADEHPEKPTIILSGNPEVVASLSRSGGGDITVMMKPVQRSAMIKMVHRLIHRREIQ